MYKTISVAMTTYNGGRFLKEQLDSIYNQTKVPDEVIVCDDNSTDETRQILMEYHDKKGLKFYINEINLGVNRNFYKAISLCTSDYIALSDQDDIWKNNKIEESYNKMLQIDKGGICAVSSCCDDININGEIISSYESKQDSFSYQETLLRKGTNQGCTLMINKRLAEFVLARAYYSDELASIMFDGMISFTAAILGTKYNIDKGLMLYRHHDRNVLGQEGKSTKFKESLTWKNTFPSFILDIRIRDISLIYDVLKEEILNKDVIDLLKKIHAIYTTQSYLRKLCVILTIKEYTILRRLKIVILSLCLKLVKSIYK